VAELPDLLEVRLRVGTERQRLGEVVGTRGLRHLLEVLRVGQLLRRGALDGSVRPDLPRGLLRLLGRLGPAAGDLAVLARVLAGALLELLDELLVRRDVDERIADLSGELRGTRLHR